MIYKSLTKSWLLLLALCFALNIQAEIDPSAGKTLFKNNCGSCHAKDMKSKSTGPALGGLEDRWAEYPREDLYNWVRNSQAVIASGHPRATELWNEYKPNVMQSFAGLSDDDIESIIAYVNEAANPKVDLSNATNSALTDSQAQSSPTFLYWILLAVLILLVWFLWSVTQNLRKIAALKEGKVYQKQTIYQSLKASGVIAMLLFGLVLFLGYSTVNKAVDLGRQEGYAPEQPIQFSHATHAGDNKIDCQYCHDGARRSKHAVIPAANTCINCHAAIKNGSQYGTSEITKIYASAGYDPMKGKYIDNYSELSPSEVEAIYKKWITDSYLESTEKEQLDDVGQEFVDNQWSDIVASLTNEQKKTVYGPIEWERIHNLPDHVYFSHAQHVTAGGLECQTCHGKVEDMDVLEQVAPLSMGWCVNCHRQTEVKFSDNEYYESYQKYHDELTNGQRDKVTVEDIGGLECQKCHY